MKPDPVEPVDPEKPVDPDQPTDPTDPPKPDPVIINPVDNTTVPIDPTDGSDSGLSWFKGKEIWIIIGGICLLFLLILLVCCCCRKNGNDPYFAKQYSIVEDQPVPGVKGRGLLSYSSVPDKAINH